MMSQPLWLLAELTYRCPLQCPYCSNPLEFAGGRFRNELGTEDWCRVRSEEHTSELQSRLHLVCRLLLEKKKTRQRVGYTKKQPYLNVNTTSYDEPSINRKNRGIYTVS